MTATAERLPGVALFPAMLALACCELGRMEEAHAAFDILADRGLQSIPEDNTWAMSVAMASSVCGRLEDVGRAAVLYELMAPYERLVVGQSLGWYGAFAHYLGVLSTTLGHYEDAERHFGDAARTHDRVGAPGWEARTRLEWARMLLVRPGPGDAARARDLLGQVLTTARDLGLGNVERAAVELVTGPSAQLA